MSFYMLNFSTNYFKEDKNGNYYFTGDWWYGAFLLIFFFVGIWWIFTFLNSQKWVWSQEVMWILIPVLFIFADLFLIVQWSKKKVFDFCTQSFYTYFFYKKTNRSNLSIPLKDIHALQIISSASPFPPGSGFPGKCYNYEINVVLQDTSRRHITNLSDLNTSQESAKKIAQRLNVPVWGYEWYFLTYYPSAIATGNPWN